LLTRSVPAARMRGMGDSKPSRFPGARAVVLTLVAIPIALLLVAALTVESADVQSFLMELSLWWDRLT